MALTAKESGGGPRILPPDGTHVARCYQVIDLGTQPGSQQYPAPKHKVRISWELPDERAVFSPDKGEQPFTVSKEYTLSLSDKANLRHDLEGWRGKAFTDSELEGFDIRNLLGVPCFLTVVHVTKGDKTYANIKGVSKLAKSMTAPDAVNESVVYEIEQGRNTIFYSLPEWLQQKINQAEEMRTVSHEEEPPTAPEEERESEDEIPF